MGNKAATTAFVLSGGASLGAIQVGMLEALYEHGITADLVIGTSAGALNGAFIASRPQTVSSARELGQVWRGLGRNQIFPLNPFTGALGFLGARSHLVPDSGLRRLIRNHALAERLEETVVPLHVIATDVLTGEDVRLSCGSLIEAVMASAAIPGVPRIYVLPTGAPCQLEEPPRGAIPMLLYATGLLIHRRLQAELAALATEAELVVLPPPCPPPRPPITSRGRR